MTNTQSTQPARSWSLYQSAVFAEVENGTGHTFVDALAGSGKSTVLEESFARVGTRKSLACAFNKSIATELQNRVQRRELRHVKAQTLHQLGLSVLYKRMAQTVVDPHKMRGIIDRLTDDRDERHAIGKLSSLGKAALAEEVHDIDAIADRFGLELSQDADERMMVCEMALTAMRQSAERLGTVDFDDMIWLPLHLGFSIPTYERVFLDEVQDLNKAQIELALLSCAPRGRILCAGDERQSIYQFRGADENAVPNIKSRLDARSLPLSITYRCPRAVVDVANRIVPRLEAAPWAKEGVVRHSDLTQSLKELQSGDFLLSRSNAPLVSAFFQLIKAGKRASIMGRDMGSMLSTLVRRSQAETVLELSKWIHDWRDREIQRLEKVRRPVESVIDRAECIFALSDGARSIDEINARIASIFEDKPGEDRIVLSTTHKAKGLERKRVFMMVDTYRKFPSVEEDNLFYVAVTRAMEELVMVRTAGGVV